MNASAPVEVPTERSLRQWWDALNDPGLFQEIEPGVLRLIGPRQLLAQYWAIAPGSLTDRLRRLEQTGAVVSQPGRGRLIIRRDVVARAIGLIPLGQQPGQSAQQSSSPQDVHPAQTQLLETISRVDDPAAITELARALTAVTDYLMRPAMLETSREEIAAPDGTEIATLPRNRDFGRDRVSMVNELSEFPSTQPSGVANKSRPNRDANSCPPTEREHAGISDWPASDWPMLCAPVEHAWRTHTGEHQDLSATHIVTAAQLWPRADLEAGLCRLQDDIEQNRPIRNLGGVLYTALSEGRYRYFPRAPDKPSDAVIELAEAVAAIGAAVPPSPELTADPTCRALLETAASSGIGARWLRHETGRRPWPSDLPPLDAVASILRYVIRHAKPQQDPRPAPPDEPPDDPPAPPLPNLTAEEIDSICRKAAISDVVRGSPNALRAALRGAWSAGVRP